MNRPPRVALVLGAGGPVGHAFHAGVLAALDEAGWDARSADLIVGTSIGAVGGGLLRAGMGAHDLFRRVVGQELSGEAAALVARAGGWPDFAAEIEAHDNRLGWPSSLPLLASLARHPRRLRLGLLLAGISRVGSVDTAPIVDGFGRVLGDRWPDRPLWIAAVELDSGRRVVFGRPGAPPSPVGVAIAASCAVPSFFAPVAVAGARYVDGGVHSPANTDLLDEALADPALRPDVVVVSLPMGIGGWPGRKGLDLPGRWLNHESAAAGLTGVRQAELPVLVVEPGPEELEVMHYDSFDLTSRGEIARRARRATAARLVRSGFAELLVNGAAG